MQNGEKKRFQNLAPFAFSFTKPPRSTSQPLKHKTVREYCFRTSTAFVVCTAFIAFLSSKVCSQGHRYYSLSLAWALEKSSFNKGRSFSFSIDDRIISLKWTSVSIRALRNKEPHIKQDDARGFAVWLHAEPRRSLMEFGWAMGSLLLSSLPYLSCCPVFSHVL